MVRLLLQGGDNLAHDQQGKLHVDLIDPDTKELLKRHYVHGNHIPRWVTLEFEVGKDRRVQIVLVDDSTEDAYAWLGIADMEINEK